MIRPILSLVLLVVFASSALAQARKTETHSDVPRLGSVRAVAPIPPKWHVQNKGSKADGAGLCVTSSMATAGAWQGIRDLRLGRGSDLFRYVDDRPGGSYPEKFSRDVAKVYPGEGLGQYVGKDTSVLARLSAKGYAVGCTMSRGDNYPGPIHHMVTNVLFDPKRDVACYIDSNWPGVYVFTSAKEFGRRLFDGGEIWLAWWTQLPGRGVPVVVLVVLGLLLLLSRSPAHETA